MPETRNSLRPWFQFSMFRLMVVVTLVAILLGLAVTFGGFIDLVVGTLACCILPTPLVIAAIFGQGDVRAFGIGALIPWGALVLMRVPLFEFFFLGIIWLLAMAGVCGVLAVATRRWLERSDLDL